MQEQERDNKELCTNGCGFFGSSASGGMCSLCWKKKLSSSQQEVNTSKISADIVVEKVKQEEISTISKDTKDCEEKPVQKNKNRCFACRKKVGYTGIECRCGYVYCSTHRYADQHDCDFDYKAEHKQVLSKQNPGGGKFVKMEKL